MLANKKKQRQFALWKLVLFFEGGFNLKQHPFLNMASKRQWFIPPEVDAWGRRRGGCRQGGCHLYRWTPLAVPVALRSRLAKGLDAELLWHVWKDGEKDGTEFRYAVCGS